MKSEKEIRELLNDIEKERSESNNISIIRTCDSNIRLLKHILNEV